MQLFTLYKIVQAIILMLFAISISDLRKKPGMTPLIDERLVLALKLSYPIPTLSYAYILITAKEFLPVVDLAALILNLLGVWLTARGRIDLGKSHTWTGYCSTSTSLITQGIYAWIRHPLYTGIYVFIIGVAAISLAHGTAIWAGVVLVGAIYIMIMLAISARRETMFLIERFGTEFEEYRNQVHAFLPLRKYES
jgi:protein-S-isoprenylcysteine O-methyltransferase Ste14